MKIGIIGGGASGLVAAITSAKNSANVTLIEKKDRVGKKILATGNGKCNFTNHSMNKFDFRSQNSAIFDDYISQFDKNAVISMFQDMGMLTKDRNGYLYPRSEQASTLLDLLRLQLKELNIPVLTEYYPISIQKKKNSKGNFQYYVSYELPKYIDGKRRKTTKTFPVGTTLAEVKQFRAEKDL